MVDFEALGGFSEEYDLDSKSHTIERESYEVNGQDVDIYRIRSDEEILETKVVSGGEEFHTPDYENLEESLQNGRDTGSWGNADKRLEGESSVSSGF